MPENNEKEIKIGTPREFSIITGDAEFKKILIVPYYISDAGHEVTVDKKGSTPESIEKAVIEDAKTFIAVEGKTLTI